MKQIFEKYKNLSIGVFGDFCLDEYLWIDSTLNEPSLETGLIAYQCIKREAVPGAAGTVAKNLANLGIGTVYAIGFVGDDGRGLELCRGLDKLGVDRDNMVSTDTRITGTHTKPWIINPDGSKAELNRIDIKNFTITPPMLENEVFERLKRLIKDLDALIIMDQWVEENCGMITKKIRNDLSALACDNPDKLFYVDSRCRIGLFDNMIIKGNQFELTHAVYGLAKSGNDSLVQLAADPTVTRTDEEINNACEVLYNKNKRPVICTMGENGARLFNGAKPVDIPTTSITGQVDVTGAGDMFTANFMSALTAGADLIDAAKIGNIAAGICVKQIGTSGFVYTEDLLAEMS